MDIIVDYSKQYLTFEAIDDCVFAFSMNDSYYSLDGCKTWVLLPANTETPIVNSGDKISFKTTNPEISGSIGIGNFGVTGRFNVEGNIMSMLYGDEFADKTDLSGWDWCFCFLFGDNDVIDASNLILPATTLADGCYADMFRGCTSLTTAPELPATKLVSECYKGMFKGCKNLNQITMLATDISASNCLTDWVSSVASTGTFVKHNNMYSLPSGANGIPESWEVEDDKSINDDEIIFNILFVKEDWDDNGQYFVVKETITLKAIKGMTWSDFIDSKYHTLNFMYMYDAVMFEYNNRTYFLRYNDNNVELDDVIEPNYEYASAELLA